MTTTEKSTLNSSAPPILQQFWSCELRRVNDELDRLLPPVDWVPSRLHQAMRHAVLAGGKRLRPILAIATYSALGGKEDSIYPVAAALEMLHTYSLIHDDLPCMDDDDQRRGQPTVHVAFDEATAVLAGDALHALAFEILARQAPNAVTEEVAHAIGTQGMLGGQMADLEAEGQAATERLVAEIHRRKTGALFIASARAGAILASANERDLACIEAYAGPLGLAFQIVDDLLEVTGDRKHLGKPVDSDSKHKKVTYPGAIGIDAAWGRARSQVAESKKALDVLSGETSILRALADFVVARDH
jgi:geranylgeranyl diphosphate synthase, type II